MAKHFNNGVIVYDGQVERFDMVALPAENIEFPQGVMKKLDYFSDEVVMPLGYWGSEIDLLPGEEFKMARMGHVQVTLDFAKTGFAGATSDRGLIRSEMAADKSELADLISDEETRALGVEAGLQGQITSNDSDIATNAAAILTEKACQ